MGKSYPQITPMNTEKIFALTTKAQSHKVNSGQGVGSLRALVTPA
jgi:hypothetical protein